MKKTCDFLLVEQICKDRSSTVSHLKWVMREDADSLLVAASNDSGSCLQVWELREKALPVHKLLGGSENQYFNTVVSIKLRNNIKDAYFS